MQVNAGNLLALSVRDEKTRRHAFDAQALKPAIGDTAHEP